MGLLWSTEREGCGVIRGSTRSYHNIYVVYGVPSDGVHEHHVRVMHRAGAHHALAHRPRALGLYVPSSL